MRFRQNYFIIWVLKPHELIRFTEVISRINGSYQWIFEQAVYEGYSPLKYTDFMEKIV